MDAIRSLYGSSSPSSPSDVDDGDDDDDADAARATAATASSWLSSRVTTSSNSNNSNSNDSNNSNVDDDHDEREAAAAAAARRRTIVARQLRMRPPPPYAPYAHRTTAAERSFAFAPYQPTHTRRTRTTTPPQAAAAAAPVVVAASTNHDRHHAGAITAVQWCPTRPEALASVALDHTLRIWRCTSSEPASTATAPTVQCQRVVHAPRGESAPKGLRALRWSVDGALLLTGGFDEALTAFDAETHAPRESRSDLGAPIASLCAHPLEPPLVLAGTATGSIVGIDLRAPGTVRRFQTRAMGEIYDLLALPPEADGTGHRVVSSSALMTRDASHRGLVVWDWRSSAMLADRLDWGLRAFTCLRLHPGGRHFVAQSTAAEALLFSTTPPYNCQRRRRRRRPGGCSAAGGAFFAGAHEVAGYRIQCSFNAAGATFATGDVRGRVVLYDVASRRPRRHWGLYDPGTPCLVAEFHPQWPTVLATGGHDGVLHLVDTSHGPRRDDEKR